MITMQFGEHTETTVDFPVPHQHKGD